MRDDPCQSPFAQLALEYVGIGYAPERLIQEHAEGSPYPPVNIGPEKLPILGFDPLTVRVPSRELLFEW
ncbi:hypothetical protein PLIIFM63780_002201 [Purpureocillium lilacinum]|nr:hypothetical protein PLIIFM63780_002201 [Purpureocillium lilacinum]